MAFDPDAFKEIHPEVTLPADKADDLCEAADRWSVRRLGTRLVVREDLLKEAQATYVLHLLHTGQEFQKAPSAGTTVQIDETGQRTVQGTGMKQHSDQAQRYLSQAEDLIGQACKALGFRFPRPGVAR